MSSTEEWLLQVSFKTANQTLINVRAKTGIELSQLLSDVADDELTTKISAVENKLGLAHTLAPLGTTPSTPAVTPSPSSQAGSVAPASPTSIAPTCVHGARVYKSGTAKATGKPYAMWTCTQPKGPTQCEAVWA
jgi:hypothetical protein